MKYPQLKQRLLVLLFLISFLVSSCASLPSDPFSSPVPPTLFPTRTPTLVPSPTITPQPSVTPTSTPEPPNFLWAAPYLPQWLLDNMVLSGNLIQTDRLVTADYLLEVGDSNPISQWVYALVAPFPTITDGIELITLQDYWGGLTREPFNGHPLLMDENTLQMISLAWGPPTRGVVKTLDAKDLLRYAWDNQPSWAIVPFEALQPKWKVLEIDGHSPFDVGFKPDGYPLSVPISLKLAPSAKASVEKISVSVPPSNYDPNLLTSVALTGVTALVRGTAVDMNAKGVLYPAEVTGPLLSSADITHISNEVPFYSECPKPYIYSAIKFCSPPSYMELLKYIGTDVVELTGDHFGDFGVDAMLETLDLYKQNNLPYYGGGINASEARKALTIEHHGNRIAFIGCNAKGLTYYASATDTQPGSVPCDMDYMSAEIARLTAEGYMVITTFQHVEYYAYDPDPLLKTDMQRMAAAGAVIVSGSQAHQPHGMTFLNNSFIHYGLGNLFFDQYRYFPGPELDYGFIDWFVFYNGRHIGTKLVTITWENLSRNRLTTLEERDVFLQTIFENSQWISGIPTATPTVTP